MLSVAEPILGVEEQDALLQVMRSGWITMGEKVRAFEREFARVHGGEDCVAVSSCTAALHLILAALDIGPGDEILVPSMSFVATANAVVYVGATPVFLDIESLDRPLCSIIDAEKKCTARTKAIVLMHYAGYSSDKEAWQAFAASRRLHIIEDAAHASGMPGVGTYGVAAAFSFYGNKNMTTAEGGAVMTRDPDMSRRIRQMRGHGLTSQTFERHAGNLPMYDMTMLGFNYRLDELRAAMGLVQVGHLHGWNDRRKALTLAYREMLKTRTSRIDIPFSPHWPSAYHIMPVLLPTNASREQVARRMRDDGIQTTHHYPPIHQMTFYRDHFAPARLPLTEEFAARQLTLPLHPKMVDADVLAVTKSLNDSL